MKRNDMELFSLFLEEFDRESLAVWAGGRGAYFTPEEITQINEILNQVYESLHITMETRGMGR